MVGRSRAGPRDDDRHEDRHGDRPRDRQLGLRHDDRAARAAAREHERRDIMPSPVASAAQRSEVSRRTAASSAALTR